MSAKSSIPGKRREVMTWDTATNMKLFLNVLTYYGDNKLDFAIIAEMMGPSCSPRAVQEQIKKLKKDAKAGSNGVTPNVASTPAGKPDKNNPTKAPQAKAASKPKGQTKNLQDTEEPTDDEEPRSKKRKHEELNAVDGPAFETVDTESAEAMHSIYEEAM